MDSARLRPTYSKELLKLINSKEFKKFITEQPSKKQEDAAFHKYVNVLAERGWFISLWHTPLLTPA
jgi:trans-aconitate methyltransferase